jgi:hypothetical protein
MNILGKLLMVLCLGMALSLLAACEKEGPAERAGKKLDQMMEETRESMEEAGEDVEKEYEEMKESEEEKGKE